MKFFFSLFLILICVSCSKEQKPKTSSPSKELRTQLETAVEEETSQIIKTLPPEKEKTTTQVGEEPQEEQEQLLPSIESYLNQIYGVYSKNVDVHWSVLDFFKFNIETQIVIAYSLSQDTLLLKMRSFEPELIGGFCLLLSDFSMEVKESENNKIYTYKSKYLSHLEKIEKPIGDVSTILKKIQVKASKDTKEWETITLILTNKDRSQSDIINLKRSHRNKNYYGLDDPEEFFATWRKDPPCL